MEKDPGFRDAVRDAQEIGQDTMNDYVEAKLLENVQNNNQRSIEFYLRHNNSKYAATQVETHYFAKRSMGRIATMPTGVDRVYYNSELTSLDKMAETMEVRQMVRDIMGRERDPDEPVNPELLGEEFARELFKALPELKATGLKQIEEYKAEKARQDEGSEG